MNEGLPDEVFNEWLALLLFDVVAEVAMVAELHHDVYSARLVVNKTVVVANYKLVVQFFVLHDFLQRFILVLSCQILSVYHFDHVSLALVERLRLELGVAFLRLLVLRLHLALEARHVLLRAVHLYALTRLTLESGGLKALDLIDGPEGALPEMVLLLKHRPVDGDRVCLHKTGLDWA